MDLQSMARWQCAQAAKSCCDPFQPTANAEDEKP
jgi:hypothetical protein